MTSTIIKNLKAATAKQPRRAKAARPAPNDPLRFPIRKFLQDTGWSHPRDRPWNRSQPSALRPTFEQAVNNGLLPRPKVR